MWLLSPSGFSFLTWKTYLSWLLTMLLNWGDICRGIWPHKLTPHSAGTHHSIHSRDAMTNSGQDTGEFAVSVYKVISICQFSKFLSNVFVHWRSQLNLLCTESSFFQVYFIVTGIFQDFPDPPAPLIEVTPRVKNGSLLQRTESFLFQI